MYKIITKNGILYYHTILKNFYIKDGLNMLIFKNKKVINSKLVQNQLSSIK